MINLDLYLKHLGFNSSFFTVVGKTGAGKSSLINALARKKICKVGSGGNSVTPNSENVHFVSNGHLFNVIDTAGLDDEDEKKNKEKIGQLKGLLENYPKIKAIIIVKNLQEVRLSKSLLESIITFMESFPLKDFWEHVIVVNTFADTDSRNFKRLMKDYIPIKEKIETNEILVKYMKRYHINSPKEIKEYFLEPALFMEEPDEYKSMGKDLEDILNRIKESYMMYKNIEVGEIEKTVIDSKIKGFFIEKHTRKIICTDYDDKKYEIVKLLKEKEIAPCKPVRTETKKVLIESKDVEWYDILSLGISWLIRDTKFYEEYEINYYKLENEKGEKYTVKGQELFVREYWK